MLNKLRSHFLSGLLALAPLFLTLFFFLYLVHLTDQLIVDPIFRILPIHGDKTFKVFLAKLAIALFVLFFLVLMGAVAEKFFMKRLVRAWEGLLKNIPLLNVVYVSVKEISRAFVGEKKGVFKDVVFVEYPRKGLYAIGFVMQDKKWQIHEKTGKDIVNVFLPHPPNPTGGFCVFVPREELIYTDLAIEEAMRLVISAGAVVPALKEVAG